MQNLKKQKYTQVIPYMFMVFLIIIGILVIKPLNVQAECTLVGGKTNVITDGSLRYQILDEEQLTVQVGTGNDEQPSASATGLYNKGITEIIIPDIVEYKGKEYQVVKVSCYAFYRCTSITDIFLGENISNIGVGAFKGCTNVKQIEWNAKAVADFSASSLSGNANIFAGVGENTDGVTVKFGKKVSRIPAYAFYSSLSGGQYCDNIVSITFGNNIQSIGDWAFAYSSKLEKLVLPQGLKEIPAHCFEKCTALKEIVIPDGIEIIGTKAFANCSAVESITLGADLIKIGNGAFTGWEQLSKINWNVRNMDDLIIGNGIFTGAGTRGEGITVVFGSDVQTIPANLFYPQKSAASSQYPNVTEIIFESSKESLTIGENAFRGCRKLTTVEIGENVIAIGNNAFRDCTAVNTLYWNAVQVADFKAGNGIFDNLGSQTDGVSVQIGKSVKVLPAYAFSSSATSYGKTVNIITVVAEADGEPLVIGMNAFYACTSILEFDFSRRASVFEDYAFYGCIGLSRLVLMDGTEKIGNYAFSGCNNVKEIELGKTITEIGIGAFNGIGSEASKSACIYNDSAVLLVKDIIYNGTFLTVYGRVAIQSEHGEVIIPDDIVVIHDEKQYAKGNQTVTITVKPDNNIASPWKITKVECNGSAIVSEKLNQYQIELQSCVNQIMVDYIERTEIFPFIVGEYGYDALITAIEEAGDGEKVIVCKDTMVKYPITIDKDIIIGVSDALQYGAVLKNAVEGNSMIKVLEGAKLSLEGALTIKGNSATGIITNEPLITVEGSLRMGPGVVLTGQQGNGKGGAIYAKGDVLMEGGMISSNQAMYGGGIYAEKTAMIKLSGGTIKDNVCGDSGNGGGIYMSGSGLYVSGSLKVVSNQKKSTANNIYLPDEASVIKISDVLGDASFGITTTKKPSVTGMTGNYIYADVAIAQSDVDIMEKYIGKIFSDNTDYKVIYKEDGMFYLQKAICTIKFDANGGQLLHNEKWINSYTAEAECGTSMNTYLKNFSESYVKKETEPSIFAGWYDEQDKLLKEDVLIADDATYYAKWVEGFCEMPRISIEEGVYYEPLQVSLESQTEKATIYYTLDGTEPDVNSKVYSEPIEISEDTILKAVSIREGYKESNTVTKSYQIRMVKEISVIQPERVMPGENVQLEADIITGNASTGKDLTWSLEGEYADGTTINTLGVLTIAEDEQQKVIRIIVTANENTEKTAVINVEVSTPVSVLYDLDYDATQQVIDSNRYQSGDIFILKNPTPRIGYTFAGWRIAGEDELKWYPAGMQFTIGETNIQFIAVWIKNEIIGISVNAESDTMLQGGKQQFVATVEGTGNYKDSVIWSVSGNTNVGTMISASGVLKIADEEMAESIQVIATSVMYSEVKGIKTIMIEKKATSTESTTEVTTETITEVLTEVTTETMTETPTEITTETITEVPVKVTTETITEVSTEVTTETMTETPTEVTTETMTEIPTEVTTETMTETPTGVTTETITEVPTEVTTEIITEVSTEVTTETVMETPTEVTTEIVTDASTEVITEAVTEMSTELTTEISTESMTEKPVVINPGQSVEEISIKAGERFTYKKAKYKILSVSQKTVEIVSLVSKKNTSFFIPAVVQYKNNKWKVTSVANNCFKNNKKLKKVVIGSNITKIGSKAFYNAKKCKSVTIKSTKLTKVGSNAFKGINKKAIIKVPKKYLKKYKKLLKKKGQKSTVKIKG